MTTQVSFPITGAVGGDLLWRMTTKSWARARRGVDRLPPQPWRDRIEVAITAITMAGMVLACLVA